MINVLDLHKSYHNIQALFGVTFQVNRGDIFGILGPNGAGKTSTMEILAGRASADSGTVLIDGKKMPEALQSLRPHMGILPENNGYYDWMTAREYMVFFSNQYDLWPSREEVNQKLREVGLQDAMEQHLGTFSRGMKQRLGLARMLIPRPKLLLLDEPTAGLAPRGRREIHDLLLKLNRDQGMTILLFTRLFDDVERVCSRMAILHHGRILVESDQSLPTGALERMFLKVTISSER